MTGDKDFDELLERCFSTLKTKGKDYAEDHDRLAEFRATADEMGITMRQALGVYMNKHLRSVKKWVKGEELKGEPVEEKLLDIIVYCLLGYKMVKEEQGSVRDVEEEIADILRPMNAVGEKIPMKHDDKRIDSVVLVPLDGLKRKLKANWTEQQAAALNKLICGRLWTADNIRCELKKNHSTPCRGEKKTDESRCDGSLSDGTPCGRKFDHNGACMK